MENSFLSASVKLLSKETGIVVNVSEEIMSSDNTSISSENIPSIAFARSGAATEYLHTEKDSLEFISPRALDKTGKFIEEYMNRYIANAPSFPFEREVPSKLKDDIKNLFRHSI